VQQLVPMQAEVEANFPPHQELVCSKGMGLEGRGHAGKIAALMAAKQHRVHWHLPMPRNSCGFDAAS
jgi:hypothetical protein